MTAPVRIQLRRTKGWRMPPNTVSVARPGRWGNPYAIERVHGKLWDEVTAKWSEIWEMRCRHWLRGVMFPSKRQASEEAVKLFREEVAPYLRTDLLRGKNLACWCGLCERHRDGKPLHVDCADCAPCHVDPLGRIANAVVIAISFRVERGNIDRSETDAK